MPKCDSIPLPTASSAFAMSLTRCRLLGMVAPLVGRLIFDVGGRLLFYAAAAGRFCCYGAAVA